MHDTTPCEEPPGELKPPPPGIPTPPPVIPKPDIRDSRAAGPTYGAETAKNSKKRKTERTHPTDPYAPLPKHRGCFGCGGCLGAFALLAILLVASLVGGYFWMGPGRFVSRGYTVVNLSGQESAEITTAPDKPTVFLAPGSLRYHVPATRVPVAIYSRELHVEGDFHDEASLNAVKITATPRARFAKDLEVNAAEFTDEGLTLKGALIGRVIRNLP
jgi:hypothetical protein